MEVICDLPENHQIEEAVSDAIDNAKYDEKELSRADAKTGVLEDLADEIQAEFETNTQLATVLTKDQSIAKSVLIKTGFVEVGRYQGIEGEISVLLRGISKVRTRGRKKAPIAKQKKRK